MQESANTKLCATRYGNVMCSRGSVIPLFVKQIKSNNPITIIRNIQINLSNLYTNYSRNDLLIVIDNLIIFFNSSPLEGAITMKFGKQHK